MQAPLAGALLAAFAAGGTAVGLLAAGSAGLRGWREWRARLDPRLLDFLAEACERTGDLRAAAEALERARLAQPESPRLARRLRDVYAAAGRWPEAVSIQGQLLLRVREPSGLAREQQMM